MLSLFLLLSAACTAFGATIPPKAAVPIHHDMTPSLRNRFELISQFAAAAACSVNHKSSSAGSPVYCDPGNCELIARSHTEIIEGFWSIHPGDTTGYIALDRTSKSILIVFRGTESDENRQADLHFEQADASDACPGCMVHRGFWEAIVSADTFLFPKIKETVEAHRHYRIITVGHSLGGALATLQAVFLRNKGYTVDLYTFGAPCVGNLAFAKFLTDQKSGENYRITHTNDDIPRILYQASRQVLLALVVPEYSQSSPEYWITSVNGVPVSTSDIQVIEGLNNDNGNLGQGGYSKVSHEWYMGSMKVCHKV